jgi:hypothetical protein
VQLLAAEVQRASAGDVVLFEPHVGVVDAPILFDTMIFDARYALVPGRGVQLGNSVLRALELPEFDGTEKGWRALPGATDAERIRGVVERVNANADFLLLIGDGSAPPPNIYANQFVGEINRGLLASSQWQPISDWIDVNPSANVRLFRNLRQPRG